MDKKNKTHLYAAYKRLTSNPKTYRLKVKGWKKIFHATKREKKAGVAVLVSDKIEFKTKKVTRDKEGHYIMIKGSTQQEYIMITNTYAANTGAHTYVKQILTELKGGNRIDRKSTRLNSSHLRLSRMPSSA